MGATGSTLSAEQIQLIESRTPFNKREIQRLYRRFQRLDKNQIGGVLKEDFATIPELAVNPMFERILATMSTKKAGVVSFEEFISTLAVFHPKAKQMDKLAFAFRLYDINDDGSVTRDELFAILKTFVVSGFDDNQLWGVVDQLIHDFDTDGNGELSFEEFTKIVTKVDVEERLTISF